jgi:predicted acyltransferase
MSCRRKLAACFETNDMKRSNSLDALRGFAILAMVLSSSIAFGILPDWMYHAQTPPPWHKFNPELPGITWVDLVFPFFLFSMGAAIPLALHKKEKFAAIGGLLQRFILLIFFALFTLHARAWVQSPTPGWQEQLISIGAFVLLCFLFIRMESKIPRIIALTAAVAFLFYKGVNVYKSDIIILVLANMAFFGSVLWWLTAKQPLIRLGVLPFIAAIFLAADTPGSWAEAIYNWSPLPWMFKFYYLKYLFIIVPGTFAGEWLLQAVPEIRATDKRKWMLIAGGAFLLVVVNVVCLFSRQLILNLALSALIGTLMLVWASGVKTWRNYLQAGVYLLWLGLFFDCTQGGIKKDPSNYSYYFVSGGLAFLVILGFSVLEYYGYATRIIRYLAINGRNPMVAYVAGNLLLLPLLRLTGAIELFSAMEQNVWLGVLRGLLFTGIVSLITLFFVHRKWYWKT